MHQDMVEQVMETFLQQHKEGGANHTHLLATVYHPVKAINTDPENEIIERERLARKMARDLFQEWHPVACAMQRKQDGNVLRAPKLFEFLSPGIIAREAIADECVRLSDVISDIVLDTASTTAVESLMYIENSGAYSTVECPQDYYLVLLEWDIQTLIPVTKVGQNLLDYTGNVLAGTAGR